MTTLWLITVTLLSVVYAQLNCPRLRRAWHTLSVTERAQYVTAINTLYSNGKLAYFCQQHADTITGRQAHQTAAFLPWHRYLLWELESQIRDLGGDFECFALPYWDWSWEERQNVTDITQIHILNSGLGNTGLAPTHCVQDGPFREGVYTPSSCSGSSGCCLTRRNTCTGNCGFDTPVETLQRIVDWDVYGSDETSNTFNGYRAVFEIEGHGVAHITIGGSSTTSANGILSDIRNSPDDPIFYLLHSFVDFNWALWQDCHNADHYHENDIPSWVYGGTLTGRGFWNRRGPSRLQDELVFPVLENQAWSYLARNNRVPTIRNMHDLQTWNVMYDEGSFFEQSKLLESGLCDMNSSWFNYDSGGLFRGGVAVEATGDVTIYDEFADNTYSLLERGDHANHNHISLNGYNTWARMNCEFRELTQGRICIRPKYFDDCSDMELNSQTGDIDITLDELIGKAGLVDCQVETRKRFYAWAVQTNTLYGLCKGDYDRFCDRRPQEMVNEATCGGKMKDYINVLSADNDDRNTDSGDTNPITDRPTQHAPPTHFLTESPAPSVQKEVITLFGDESLFTMTGLSDWDKIMISTFMNGIMFMIVITFCTGLHCVYSSKYGAVNKVHFEAIDDDQYA